MFDVLVTEVSGMYFFKTYFKEIAQCIACHVYYLVVF
jgi:hypothetical protein